MLNERVIIKMKIAQSVCTDLNLDICSLRGTPFENYLYLTQEELNHKLKETIKEVENAWNNYTVSGERFGTSEERSKPDASYTYTTLLEKMEVLSKILWIKAVNQQRLYHLAIDIDMQRALKIDLINTVIDCPELTYLDLLELYPDYEIELLIEDMIENVQLVRNNIGQKKEKWALYYNDMK